MLEGQILTPDDTMPPKIQTVEDLPFQEVLPNLEELKNRCVAKQQELKNTIGYPTGAVQKFLDHLDAIIAGQETKQHKFGDPENTFDRKFFNWLNGQKVNGYQIIVEVLDISIYETDGKTVQVKNETYNVSIAKTNEQ